MSIWSNNDDKLESYDTYISLQYTEKKLQIEASFIFN